jgi:hypothetical protein
MTCNLKPGMRKFLLTTHIIFSVGWAGAVAVFLAHAIVGLTTSDNNMMSAAYVAMCLSCWLVIVPANLGSLLTGLVQALCTPWGLFRHWWILIKLILTIGCTILLFLHTSQIGYLAQTAPEPAGTRLQGLRVEIMYKAAAALLVLMAITAISVYKPWGLTPFGQRKLRERTDSKTLSTKSKWLYVLFGLLILLVFFMLHRHLGGSIHH